MIAATGQVYIATAGGVACGDGVNDLRQFDSRMAYRVSRRIVLSRPIEYIWVLSDHGLRLNAQGDDGCIIRYMPPILVSDFLKDLKKNCALDKKVAVTSSKTQRYIP